jgi:hypothetical protein
MSVPWSVSVLSVHLPKAFHTMTSCMSLTIVKKSHIKGEHCVNTSNKHERDTFFGYSCPEACTIKVL